MIRRLAGRVAPLLLAVPGVAAAQDWRVAAPTGTTIYMIDLDSVRIDRKGNVRANAAGFEREPSAKGPDSFAGEVQGRCKDLKGSFRRVTLFRDGRKVSGSARSFAGELEWIVPTICAGGLGYRHFDSPAAVRAALDQARNRPESLTGYLSPETDLIGEVVQGFERNSVTLCGAEAGCAAHSGYETCWLEGPIELPVRERASDNVARDWMDLRFRGTVYRTRGFERFGHMDAFTCLVRATGEPSPVTLPPPPAQAPDDAIGQTAGAKAAYAALAAALGPATVTINGKSWRVGGLAEAAAGKCYSIWDYQGGTGSGPSPGGVRWAGVQVDEADGPALAIRLLHRRDGASATPNPATADAIVDRLSPLIGMKIAGYRATGRRIIVSPVSGSDVALDFPDAGAAMIAISLLAEMRDGHIRALHQDVAGIVTDVEDRILLRPDNPGAVAGLVAPMRRLAALCRGES